MTNNTRRFSMQDFVAGTLLIFFGAILLLHQTDVLSLEMFGVQSVWKLWPVVLIVIGIAKLADAPSIHHIGSGAWWLFLGIWLYVSINHVYGLGFGDTWPALLIAWGVSMMWESLVTKGRGASKDGCYGKY